jgi:hypothetical protein
MSAAEKVCAVDSSPSDNVVNAMSFAAATITSLGSRRWKGRDLRRFRNGH